MAHGRSCSSGARSQFGQHLVFAKRGSFRRSNRSHAPNPTPIIRLFCVQRTLQRREHRQIISDSPGSTAPRPSKMRGANPFSCGAKASQIPYVKRIRIAKSQGSRSQQISVEMIVIRARNVPHIKTTVGGKREPFVTIAHGATTKKTKEEAKRTKSVHIDGRTLGWDQRLDAFFLKLSSQRVLRLHAKRLTKILIRTQGTVIPAESEGDISVVLGHGNGQADHASWIGCVGFSPDGQRIVSGSEDRTIHVWNNATTGVTCPVQQGGRSRGHEDC
ncbi:hypothetical protein EDB92DRAFT_759389 [Lactarius akahatsu]|uniref:Uncharacterized protein n=1 Tax=Lactarius akahatsu TaxID=416441 RepID=A0AAD4Q7L6_9AGAM|nr:hypothetical protein EDB92DRAFT_759389 [Lactarius akahatsu]